MNALDVNIHVHLDRNPKLRQFSTHGDGGYSWQIESRHSLSPVTMYLTGTPDELRAWGAACIAAANETAHAEIEEVF